MKKALLVIGIICLFFTAKSQNWTELGSTYVSVAPYPLRYFLLLDLAGDNGDVSAEIEILVMADDNYMYHSRYSVFASRHSGSPTGRLDGVSMNYISGKPGLLEVIVKENQIWVKATKKWGTIKYRLISERRLGNWKMPLTNTTERPAAIVASATQPFYYDFDEGVQNCFPSLKANGNVGIGVADPGNYKLAVNGTVHAKEVKVDLNGWSDFVFTDDYKLKKLEYVESFINENKHLPDIPSEKEVLDNGIQLGEMDAKLLQKIEELTLYIIEMNKKMETLNQKVKTLEAQL